MLWLGGPAFRGKAEGLDGVIGEESGGGGWIDIASLSPGRDNSAIQTTGDRRPASVELTAAGASSRTPNTDARMPTIESRRLGRAYIEGWISRLRAHPDWLVLDSWNDFRAGTDIAPAHEFGQQFVDLTRAGASQIKGGVEYAVNILRATVPAVMAPRTLYQVEVLAQNSGQKGWTGSGIGLSYRWFKDGQPVGDAAPIINVPYTPPNDVRNFNVGVTGPMTAGKPLPDGDYELRLDMARLPAAWFESPSSLPYIVPVRISAGSTEGEASRCALTGSRAACPHWRRWERPTPSPSGCAMTAPRRGAKRTGSPLATAGCASPPT